MSELEEKLGSILSNPQMMQQIMAMAQAMGNASQSSPPPPPEAEPQAPSMPSFDPKLLQSLAGMAEKSGVDQNQQTLLNALCPYLSQNRVHKLEKAMRAAKIAGFASSFLNSGGLQLLTGR